MAFTSYDIFIPNTFDSDLKNLLHCTQAVPVGLLSASASVTRYTWRNDSEPLDSGLPDAGVLCASVRFDLDENDDCAGIGVLRASSIRLLRTRLSTDCLLHPYGAIIGGASRALSRPSGVNTWLGMGYFTCLRAGPDSVFV